VPPSTPIRDEMQLNLSKLGAVTDVALVLSHASNSELCYKHCYYSVYQ